MVLNRSASPSSSLKRVPRQPPPTHQSQSRRVSRALANPDNRPTLASSQFKRWNSAILMSSWRGTSRNVSARGSLRSRSPREWTSTLTKGISLSKVHTSSMMTRRSLRIWGRIPAASLRGGRRRRLFELDHYMHILGAIIYWMTITIAQKYSKLWVMTI